MDEDQESASALAWETTDRRTAYTCPGFHIIHETVTLPDGTETDFDYLHDEPAVVIVPVTTDGSLVVIEEWRQAVKRVNLGFPAGSVEADDEELASAARRELAEETGYVAETMTYLDSLEPANGVTDAVHHYFLAEDCRPVGSQALDFNESIAVRETTLEDLQDALRDGEIRDGRTALGVFLYSGNE